MKKTIILFFLFMLTISCTTAPATTLPPSPVASDSNASQPLAPTQTCTPIPAITLPLTSASAAAPTLTASPVAITEIRRITQRGGSIHGITVVGDMAYVGIGPRLGVIDISQHDNPILVTQSEILPGLVTTLLQISSNRLVISAGKYLVVMDIAHIEEPKPILELGLEGAIMAMAFDDRTNKLYVGGAIHYSRHSEGTDGFVVAFNITPEDELLRLNLVSIPEVPISLALGDHSLFAGANGEQGGLYYFQVKTSGELSPPQLVIASNMGTPLVPTSMQVIDERLYLGYRGVEAYDITNPEQPVQVWRGSSPGINVVTSFTIFESQVYMIGFSIREPDIPVFGSISLGESSEASPVGEIASFTTVHNGDFIVADRSLSIFTAAINQDLQRVGSYLPIAANVIDAVANEKAVYVIDNGVGDGQSKAVMWTLSLPDLQRLGQVATEFPNSFWEGFRDMALDGDRIYLATEDNIWIYDISVVEPTLLGKVEIREEQITEIAAITLDGKRLLFATHSNDVFNKFNLYDLTDVQISPMLIDSLNLDQGYGLHLILTGSTATILLERTSDSSSNSRLYAIDFDSNKLKIYESLDLTDDYYHLAAGNDLIVLTGTSHSMDRSIISFGQSEPFKLLFTLTLAKDGQGVGLVGESALAVAGNSWDFRGEEQVLIYDLRSPSYPRLVEMLDIAFSDTHNVPIVHSSPYAILVNGAGGVEVLDYSH